VFKPTAPQRKILRGFTLLIMIYLKETPKYENEMLREQLNTSVEGHEGGKNMKYSCIEIQSGN
jgi:hypothetical protein